MGIILVLAAGTVATPLLVGIVVKLLLNIVYKSYTGREPSFFFAFLYYVALGLIIWIALPVIEVLLVGTPPYAVGDKPLSQLVMLSPIILVVVLLYAGIKGSIRLIRFATH